MRTNSSRLAMIGVALLLSSCAQPPVWEKAGADQEQFKEDSDDCEHAVPRGGYFGSGIGAGPTATAAMEEAYANCMTNKGWKVRVK